MDVQRDVLDITNVLAEYCLASDDGRFEDWARCFTEDGEVHAFRQVYKGFDALVAFIRSAPGGLHMSGLPHITLDGDRAEVVTNFLFFTDANELSSKGKYVDEFVRTPAGWRIQSRRIRILKPHE